MKSLNAILVFASLAAAAPAASADAAAPIEARQAASPCRYEQKLTWNTGQIAGDGGWAVCFPLLPLASTAINHNLTIISVYHKQQWRLQGILLEGRVSLLQRKHKTCPPPLPFTLVSNVDSL